MMRGSVTEKRYGLLPATFIDYLTKPEIVNYHVNNEKPTYFVGEIVAVMDDVREKVAKPVFRAMPLGFRIWYDKVRYKM